LINPEPWRGRLLTAVAGVQGGEDPEAAHDLRVAAGRLRVYLGLASWRFLRPDLRYLRRQAASLRDYDVALARTDLPPELAEFLAAAREMSRAELRTVLLSPRIAGLLPALAYLPKLASKEARHGLPELLEKVLQRGRYLETPEQWHGLRRAVRNLRYALEWLDQDTAVLKDLQDTLGEMGDLMALLRVSSGLDSVVMTPFLSLREAELEASQKSALRAWQKTKPQITDILE
jgi:CHAD domain-containing protein